LTEPNTDSRQRHLESGLPGDQNLNFEIKVESPRNAVAIKLVESIIRGLANFLVGIIVVRKLGVSQFAAFAYVTSLVAMVGPVAGLGIDVIVARTFALDEDSQQSTLRLAVKIKATGMLLACVLLFVYSALVEPKHLLIILFGSILLSSAISEVPILLVQTREGSREVARLRLPALAVGVVVKLSCIFFIPSNIVLFFVASAVEPVYLFVAALARIRKYPSRCPKRLEAVVSRMLREALPYLMSGVAIAVYTRMDVILLDRWSTEIELARYSVVVKVSELMNFLPLAITAAMSPKLLALYKKNELQALARVQKLTIILSLIACGLICILVILAPAILSLGFGAQYRSAANVLRVHSLSLLFVFVGVSREIWFLASRSGRVTLYSTVAGAVCNIFINSLLVPKYGAMGAAVSTAVSYFCAAILFPLFSIQGRQFFFGM
jgi:polysaccharide transporter, PST family